MLDSILISIDTHMEHTNLVMVSNSEQMKLRQI